jgi:hypothetical protein
MEEVTFFKLMYTVDFFLRVFVDKPNLSCTTYHFILPDIKCLTRGEVYSQHAPPSCRVLSDTGRVLFLRVSVYMSSLKLVTLLGLEMPLSDLC